MPRARRRPPELLSADAAHFGVRWHMPIVPRLGGGLPGVGPVARLAAPWTWDGSLRAPLTAIAVLAAAVWSGGVAPAEAQTTYDHVVVVMFENTDASVAMGQPNFAGVAT